MNPPLLRDVQFLILLLVDDGTTLARCARVCQSWYKFIVSRNLFCNALPVVRSMSELRVIMSGPRQVLALHIRTQKKLWCWSLRGNPTPSSPMISLLHPNLVRCLGEFVNHKNALVVVEEYAKEQLVNILERWPAIKLEERHVAYICRSILRALNYVHMQTHQAHGKVRCDMVYLFPDGSVKISNPRTNALLAQEVRRNVRATRTTVVGTPYWAAPESIAVEGLGEDDPLPDLKPTGPAGDVWALGVLAFECIVGEPPFMELPPLQALRHIADGPPPFIAVGSDVMRHFVAQCLTHDATCRPSTSSLLSHDFLKLACSDKEWSYFVDCQIEVIEGL